MSSIQHFEIRVELQRAAYLIRAKTLALACSGLIASFIAIFVPLCRLSIRQRWSIVYLLEFYILESSPNLPVQVS